MIQQLAQQQTPTPQKRPSPHDVAAVEPDAKRLRGGISDSPPGSSEETGSLAMETEMSFDSQFDLLSANGMSMASEPFLQLEHLGFPVAEWGDASTIPHLGIWGDNQAYDTGLGFMEATDWNGALQIPNDNLEIGFEEVHAIQTQSGSAPQLESSESGQRFLIGHHAGPPTLAEDDLLPVYVGKEEALAEKSPPVAGSEQAVDDTTRIEIPENLQREEAVDYDPCFGVLLIDVSLTTSMQGKVSGSPVTLQRRTGLIKVHFLESGQFAGVVVSSGVVQLMGLRNVKLAATLHEKQHPVRLNEESVIPRKGKGKANKPSTSKDSKCNIETVTARVVVYGKMDDKTLIADLLADSDLFLQHPIASEIESDVSYFNPNFLVRPGGEMPRLADLEISDKALKANTRDTELDEVARGRIWRIFDMGQEIPSSSSIEQSPRLKTKLKPHQLSALAIMVERERGIIEGAQIPTLWRPFRNRECKNYSHAITGLRESNPQLLRGGVLADEMGLGKTLTTLALICGHLDERESRTLSGPQQPIATLIVAPKTAILAWETQIRTHIDLSRISFVTYYGPSRHQVISQFAESGIVLTTYDVLRMDLISGEDSTVYSHRWHRVVLDEAHKIRNRSSKLHQAALALSKQADCRWCLTGTPVNNSLDDYGALLSFIETPDLSQKRSFDFWIANPLKSAGLQEQKRGNDRLQDLVLATCLRRTISQLVEHGSVRLERPVERTEYVEFNRDERNVYNFFKNRTMEIVSGLNKDKVKMKGDDNILCLINFLRLICNYGEFMLPDKAKGVWEAQESVSIDWQMMQQLQRQCSRCGHPIPTSSCSISALQCGHELCQKCDRAIAERDDEERPDMMSCLACQQSNQKGVALLRRRSEKAKALVRNILADRRKSDLEGRHSAPQKCVVFSAWTKMLDLVQQDLTDEGIRTLRIDGQTSLRVRGEAIKQFQTENNYTVMLASIGSAGEGIDFTSACHIHILEPQWNPMTESQAIGRINRIGQTRHVHVTKYIVSRSIEAYVQSVQQDKLRLIERVNSETSQRGVDLERLRKLEENLAVLSSVR